MSEEQDTLVVTPIDLALRSLPAPRADAGAVSVDGCEFQIGDRAVPIDAHADACKELWSNLLIAERTTPATRTDGTIAWTYRFTREHDTEQVRRSVNMRFEGDDCLVEPTAGTVQMLACHDADNWQLVQLIGGPREMQVDPSAVREMRRLPGCEALIFDSGRSYSVPVQQEVTLEFLAIQSLMMLVVAGPLALVLGMALRRLFQRRVQRSLAVKSDAPQDPEPPASIVEPRSALRLVSPELADRGVLFASTIRRSRIGTIAFAVAGLVCSVILGVALNAAHTPDEGFGRIALWTLLGAWPILPTIALLSYDRRIIFPIFVLYLVIYLTACSIMGVSFLNAAKILAGTQIVSLGVIGLLLLSPFRHIGPWILAASWVAAAALNAPFVLVQGPQGPILLALSEAAVAIGLESGWATMTSAALVSLFVVLPLLWLGLRLLTRAYVRFRLSDRFVIVGSVWVLHILMSCAFAMNVGADRAIVWSLIGLPLGPTVVLLVLRLPRSDRAKTRRLLYLRTFAGRRGQIDIFGNIRNLVAEQFRIELIAGPDLATKLVQPFELLDFVAGKGARGYLNTREELEARLALPENTRDAEGRFLLRQFFCANSVWKDVFMRLSASADVVLMDLRGLSQERVGTTYELTQVIQRVPLERILLLVDRRTDRAYVDSVALSAWAALPASSPNALVEDPSVVVLEHDSGGRAELVRLLRHICCVAESRAIRSRMPSSGSLDRLDQI